jgi:hypothetical protein
MPIENIAWLLPAGAHAWKSRDEISSVWQAIANVLLGRKSRIAFTGLSGAGKTVLHDCLTGRAFEPDYAPLRAPSVEADKGTIRAKRKRLALTTVPGQAASTTRAEVLEKVFDPKKPVDGVVHVVSNGFIEFRDPTAREALVTRGGLNSLEKFRKRQLSEELSHLKEICTFVRRCQHKSQKPRWLIVAVTKADLFLSKMEKAKARYSPAGSGGFVDALDELVNQVGTDSLTWTAMPVCGWPEPFEWNGENVQSEMTVPQRAFYVRQMAETLRNLCASV